jgi:restriction system protein
VRIDASVGVDVARRRGFFAELNHQMVVAERKRQQQARQAERARLAARRAAERSERAAMSLEQAQARNARSTASAAARQAEADARRERIEAGREEAAARNSELSGIYAEIDGILASTLAMDDYVDLQTLRVVVEHPLFDPGPLAQAATPPSAPVYPPQPVYLPPQEPTGMAGMLGGKRRYELQLAEARRLYEEQARRWKQYCDSMYAAYQITCAQYQSAEQAREAALAEAQARYLAACQQREKDASDQNAELDRLINDLAFDVPWAIQEYVGIVLSDSVYPDSFSVSHDFRFDLESRELTLTVRVPPPSAVPSVKEYRYQQNTDQVVSTNLPAMAQKERYASAVWQVALRTLHEVFEADRVGRIHSISLTVETGHIDPATGLSVTTPLLVAGADRRSFLQFDLSQVTPAATLQHLGAAMSKNPFGLTPADTNRGVRGRGRRA